MVMDENLVAEFSIEENEEIEATFEINLAPNKLSQLENDMNFVSKEDIDLPDISNLATKDEVKQVQSNIPKLQLITQTEYDSLTTKDTNTLYLIEEE